MKIPVGSIVVEGTLTLPPGAKGVVLFAHGSGSSRFSPRNQYVAKEFSKAKSNYFSTFYPDEEKQTLLPRIAYHFAAEWLIEQPSG
jgi:hypothetical protein